MWDKLFALFNKDLAEEESLKQPSGPQSSPPESFSAPANTVMPDGPSTNISFNYLKGMDDESEDDINRPRRFTNLNKLLRGSYDGQTTPVNARSESNIRGEDSE